MILSFDEFLAGGRLGDIQIGLSEQTVRQMLGEPTDHSVQQNPKVLRYGPIELTFYKARTEAQPALRLIYWRLDSSPRNELPKGWSFTGWLPTPETTLEQFQEYVGRADMVLQPAPGDEQFTVVPTPVIVGFRDGKLESANVAGGSVPVEKQLSLRLPMSDWQKLRSEATRRRLSMAELGAQWIRERVS